MRVGDIGPWPGAGGKVIERNIRTMIRLRLKAVRERSVHEQIADAITSFSGRMGFVYGHVVWFGLWILLNTDRVGVRAFDPFPYGLLTMIVSLEAIFLSAVVLISQNRLSAEIERRADLDLHIGLLTEHELTRLQQRALGGTGTASSARGRPGWTKVHWRAR